MASVLTATGRSRFVLELLTPEGKPLGDISLDRPDFDRAIEAVFFEGLRRGAFQDYGPAYASARIEPRFLTAAPRSAGFEVVLPTPQGDLREVFPLDYFKTFARRNGARLALRGQLTDDAVFTFQLLAFAEEANPRKRGGLQIDFEEETPAIPIREGNGRATSLATAWDAPTRQDFPVHIPRHVLEEAVAEARSAPEREVGGVLLGHLCRDGETHELYLDVTCLVPCEGTEATEVSVTFTHETWARVREVVDWRGEGELIVGWSHSHPFRLCAECPNPVPTECQAKVLFYSADDEFLMESTFARPFMVGLLAAVEPRLEQTLGRLPVKLFGWRKGVIVPRGFEVSEV